MRHGQAKKAASLRLIRKFRSRAEMGQKERSMHEPGSLERRGRLKVGRAHPKNLWQCWKSSECLGEVFQSPNCPEPA